MHNESHRGRQTDTSNWIFFFKKKTLHTLTAKKITKHGIFLVHGLHFPLFVGTVVEEVVEDWWRGGEGLGCDRWANPFVVLPAVGAASQEAVRVGEQQRMVAKELVERQSLTHMQAQGWHQILGMHESQAATLKKLTTAMQDNYAFKRSYSLQTGGARLRESPTAWRTQSMRSQSPARGYGKGVGPGKGGAGPRGKGGGAYPGAAELTPQVFPQYGKSLPPATSPTRPPPNKALADCHTPPRSTSWSAGAQAAAAARAAARRSPPRRASPARRGPAPKTPPTSPGTGARGSGSPLPERQHPPQPLTSTNDPATAPAPPDVSVGSRSPPQSSPASTPGLSSIASTPTSTPSSTPLGGPPLTATAYAQGYQHQPWPAPGPGPTSAADRRISYPGPVGPAPRPASPAKDCAPPGPWTSTGSGAGPANGSFGKAAPSNRSFGPGNGSFSSTASSSSSGKKDGTAAQQLNFTAPATATAGPALGGPERRRSAVELERRSLLLHPAPRLTTGPGLEGGVSKT